MRLREENDGYDFMCTHVDDFKVVAKDPDKWTKSIGLKFQLKIVEKPRYYLGTDYTYSHDFKSHHIDCQTYIKESIQKIESHPMCNGKLFEHKTPMPDGVHPETDDSELLDVCGIKNYQILIGMAQWAMCLSCLDIAFATSSLSRFNVNPRENHLKLALHLFDYLKKYPN